ncbi:excinuclease ABC subunit C [Taurinivorans muris]|uniref:UvrABC system protein C n=1 Tax=Taurinivorans muris TaxID=2787751 RepID=A0ABY5Y0Q6_9BACT|nr:excinuclease ABC subunit C [Desulfovibrionaceae bacterium LT0009]
MERPNAIPTSPGVYLYKDKGGRIIYVGKARNLKKRVLSYFRPDEQLTAKTRAMMSHAVSVEFLTTSTEKEALLLEASLIKKHRPHYNIVLRDDKQYILFRIAVKNAYPRLEVVRKVKKDGAHYFGPFTSSQAARETWKALHSVFPLRRCNDRAMKNRVRPCLYHHIGLCLAPCSGEVRQETYFEIIQKVELLLSGKSRELLEMITRKMEEASENLEFEEAAKLRDQKFAIEKTVEKQGVVFHNGTDMDVMGLCSRGDGLALAVLFVRGGQVIDKAAFFWAGLVMEDANELLLGFLTQFYSQDKDIPPRIVLPWALTAEKEESVESPALIGALGADYALQEHEEDLESIAAMLSEWRGANVRIVAARTKDDEKLVEIAKTNARETVYKRSDLGMDERLAALFKVQEPIRRIECVDVSHTSGTATKVGLVVYQDGKPHKADYRVWNMENTNGDDYLALSQWAKRRAEHGAPWPHLLLIDGGRGQVNSVHASFQEFFSAVHVRDSQSFDLEEGRLPFVLAGIAKARDEQGHADRRAGNLADRIFLPDRTNPLPFKEGSSELLFLQSIRDATHDFAIGRHRQARNKQGLDAQLLHLPHVGQETAKLLWQHFKSIEEMKKAGVEELMKLPKVGRKKALQLRDSLQKL